MDCQNSNIYAILDLVYIYRLKKNINVDRLILIAKMAESPMPSKLIFEYRRNITLNRLS